MSITSPSTETEPIDTADGFVVPDGDGYSPVETIKDETSAPATLSLAEIRGPELTHWIEVEMPHSDV